MNRKRFTTLAKEIGSAYSIQLTCEERNEIKAQEEAQQR